MTLVAVKKQDYDLWDDERLGRACMEPTFLQIRGKDMSVKTQVVAQLTKPQQALCMFRILYDHAKNSVSEYYAWISYLVDKPDYWSGVLEGLRFFGDTSMIRLLEETKKVLEARNSMLGALWSDAAFKDLEHDDELLNCVSRLFQQFVELAPENLKQISTYIRSNPQHFVIIES